jgi:hypothetical protein
MEKQDPESTVLLQELQVTAEGHTLFFEARFWAKQLVTGRLQSIDQVT